MTLPQWRKSSYSASTTACVEIATVGKAVLVRDSKHPDDGHLSFAPAELAALVDACKTGLLDDLA
jgi:hypothetical protein